jgi:hypothetical protein
MDIPSGIIWLRCNDDANSAFGEILQFTPNASRNDKPLRRIVHSDGSATAAIINFDDETTRNWKNNLMARPMGMTTARLAMWYIGNPEYASHIKGNMNISL